MQHALTLMDTSPKTSPKEEQDPLTSTQTMISEAHQNQYNELGE